MAFEYDFSAHIDIDVDRARSTQSAIIVDGKAYD